MKYFLDTEFHEDGKRNWRRVKEIAHVLVLILAAILFWVAVAVFQYYGR